MSLFVEMDDNEAVDDKAVELLGNVDSDGGLEQHNMGFFKRFFKAQRGGKDAYLYWIRETCSWILVLAVAFISAILINMYVIRMSNVVGDSMLQTYHGGDRVFLSRLPYIFGEPEKGDVIVFDSTKEEKDFFANFGESVKFNLITQLFMKQDQLASMQHKYYIKRVIGTEGDVVSIKDGCLYINDELIENEEYVNPAEKADYSRWEGQSWIVGSGCVFVMGDNRNHSTDSRAIGVIPEGCILGKVVD